MEACGFLNEEASPVPLQRGCCGGEMAELLNLVEGEAGAARAASAGQLALLCGGRGRGREKRLRGLKATVHLNYTESAFCPFKG